MDISNVEYWPWIQSLVDIIKHTEIVILLNDQTIQDEDYLGSIQT